MQRLMNGTKETVTTLLGVSCLVVGITAAAVYILGPGGWLNSMLQEFVLMPNLGTPFALAGTLGLLAICKRWLDRNPRSLFNNLLVGAVGLGGFMVLLQALRAFVV